MYSDIDTESFKRFEKEGYSEVAKQYKEKAVAVTSQVNQAVLDVTGVVPGEHMLDVACGPGALSADAVRRGTTVTGLDFAPNMIAVAREGVPQGEFHEGDAESLPFPDAAFDAVVCSLGLLHFPNPEKAVAEAHRVLKPGKRYTFTCWTPPEDNAMMAIIFGSVQAHGNLDVGIPPGPPLFRFGNPTECENVLGAQGFQDITVLRCPISWPAAAPEQFFEDILSSTARMAPLLALQAEQDRGKIREAIIDGARAYQTSDGVSVPSAILVASGMKPAH